MDFVMQLLPIVGAISLVVVGIVAAVGYARTQAGKTWRESAEGWRTENDANKARADRLANDLARTATELQQANMRTDISSVLGVLQAQHKEATSILTRIADESSERAESQTALLQRIADESAERNGHIADTLATHQSAEARVWNETLKVAAETLETVEALRSLNVAALSPKTRRKSAVGIK